MARGVWLAGRREQRLLQLFIVKIIELTDFIAQHA
jgi:hypothetical protein